MSSLGVEDLQISFGESNFIWAEVEDACMKQMNKIRVIWCMFF